MARLAIDALDFVYVLGDAYIDHPSFGAAIIARVLQAKGFSVGFICQPDWHDVQDFRRLGRPRLGFLVSSGNIDSMVNHYTAAKKRRSEDAYSEGGQAGKRPDRATIVYANRCREAFPGVPVIIGGIEASLRRFAHYDYWDDKVRHSILYDAGADLLLYGMGERSIVALAEALDEGTPIRNIRHIPGSCYQSAALDGLETYVTLPAYQEVAADKRKYAEAFMAEAREQDAMRGRTLVQAHEKGYLVCNPPSAPLTRTELDAVYALPFTRKPHPMYKGPIPALAEVAFSLTSCRGCFGGCNFCALTFHQGRVVTSRSEDSLVKEAETLTRDPGFKGYIHDVGGPTANFRHPACPKQTKSGVCPDRQCIGHDPCPVMKAHADEKEYVYLLRRLRRVPGVKKVFVRSGVRFDYALFDKDDSFLRELVQHHVSGQLKVAPEHVAEGALAAMNKPSHEVYEAFLAKYARLNKQYGLKQYVVPYFISSHPGCTLADAIELSEYLKSINHRPEQVQDFYPTPGTVSTCMYYTGLDPRTMAPIHVPKGEEKRMQRALMQYWLPQNRPLVEKALRLCHREDLIGRGGRCLIPERQEATAPKYTKKKGKPGKNLVDKRPRNK
jgi:uncharacterized radical SAM protein YgiQ